VGVSSGGRFARIPPGLGIRKGPGGKPGPFGDPVG
jgi:hypothetical protein